MKNCPKCDGSYPENYTHCPLDGTPLAQTADWSEGTVVRGKYRILAKIGEGGMGTVFQAQHLRFKELCAIKVMSGGLSKDPVFLKRFEHEAVLTRRLQHANAVRVEDFDETEDGRPFIVMEYIKGASLKDLIDREAPLPAPRVCSIAKAVSSALDAAHGLGMIHRDVKPANIVLVEGDKVKVLDFGIAKIKEGMLENTTAAMTLTGTGMAIGTPSYMSPEQALGKRGDELDGRSDLYSLGVVMYEMLTGSLPFAADTPILMMMAQIQTPPRPFEAIGQDVPPGLRAIVMSCLEKNPDLRPASGQALIGELERWEAESTKVSREPQLSAPRPVEAAPLPPVPVEHARRVEQPTPSQPHPTPTLPPEPVRARRHGWFPLALAALIVFLGAAYLLLRPTSPPRPPAPAGQTAADPPINLRPQGYVNDFAEVLSPADHERLATLCSQVEQKTSAQIAVVTIQSLPGDSIEDFAHRLFNQWGIGQKNQNNGALILVAVNDHKDRVEVGRGLEPILPYTRVAGLLADARPAFERQDLAAALNQLTRSVAAAIGQANGIALDLPAPPTPQPTTAAGSTPPVPRKDAAAKRITVSSSAQETKVTFQPPPVYPTVAKSARVEGVVRLSAVIDRNGNIAELKLISGHPLLVQASLDAVSKWRYQPTVVNGEPVEVATEIDVGFALKH